MSFCTFVLTMKHEYLTQSSDDTYISELGILSGFRNPCYLDISRHFRVHLFRSGRPGSASGKGGLRLFTEVVPTPHHADNCQRSVKTKRGNDRTCASVVTRKRPSLNRAGFGCLGVPFPLRTSPPSPPRPNSKHASSVLLALPSSHTDPSNVETLLPRPNRSAIPEGSWPAKYARSF